MPVPQMFSILNRKKTVLFGESVLSVKELIFYQKSFLWKNFYIVNFVNAGVSLKVSKEGSVFC